MACERKGHKDPEEENVDIGEMKLKNEGPQVMEEDCAQETNSNDEFGEDKVTPLNDLGAAIISGNVNDVLSLLNTDNINAVCASTDEDYFFQPLQLAAREDQFDIAKILLENGADDKASVLYENGRVTGSTALYYAAGCARLDFVKLLLDRNFDINQRNAQGNSLLNIAITCNGTDVIEYLLDQGADPTIACSGQWEYEDLDALDSAVITNRSDVVRMLIDRGCSVNRRTQSGITPLMFSLEFHEDVHENKEIIHLLLENGADPNHADILGCTAVHALAKTPDENQCEYIDILSKYGLDVNAQAGNGQTALHLLANRGSSSTVRKLLELGADTNIKDLDGNTPTHLAAGYSNFEVLELLFQSGWKNVVNCFQETVSDILVKNEAKYRDVNCLKKLLVIALGVEVEGIGTSDRLPIDTYSAKTLLQISSSEIVLKRFVPIFYKFKWDVFDKRARLQPNYDKEPKDNESLKKLENTSMKNRILSELCHQKSMGTFHWDCECPGVEEEKCLIVREVNTLVEKMAERTGKKDRRFKITMLPSGSSFEGAKMDAPDECDYLLVLEELSKPGVCELVSITDLEAPIAGYYSNEIEPGYSFVRVHKSYREIWKEFVTDEGILLPAQLRYYLSVLLWDAGAALPDRGQSNLRYNLVTNYMEFDAVEEDYTPLVRSTNVGACLNLRWRGTHYREQLIDVDLVLAIRLPGWPEEARELPGNMKYYMQNGFHVVPKNATKDTLGWRKSFSLAETEILRNVSLMQMNCYRSLKFLKDTLLLPVYCSLSTYIFKTEFLHYLTVCTERDWEEKDLSFHVRSVLQKFLTKVGEEDLTLREDSGENGNPFNSFHFHSFFIPSCIIATVGKKDLLQDALQKLIHILQETEM